MPHDLTAIQTVIYNSIWTVVLSAATYAALYRFIGEKLFGHWLERRLTTMKSEYDVKLAGVNASYGVKLEGVKAENNVSLEAVKHIKNAEIENLRAAISHLSDRGKHSNQREFDALSSIWEKYVELHYATNVAAASFIRYPDLNKFSSEELEEFLKITDFSDRQKNMMREIKDKNRGYTSIITTGYVNKAQVAYYEFQIELHKQGIFITKELKIDFDGGSDLCLKLIGEKRAEVDFGAGMGAKATLDFMQRAPGLLEIIKDNVRDRLLTS
jgi:hypothetical protein